MTQIENGSHWSFVHSSDEIQVCPHYELSFRLSFSHLGKQLMDWMGVESVCVSVRSLCRDGEVLRSEHRDLER